VFAGEEAPHYRRRGPAGCGGIKSLDHDIQTKLIKNAIWRNK
jgi:hypothetical protein